MNEEMIREWNTVVHPSDTVYLLGDVAFMSANQATAVVCRLNGNKILIEGNHDRKLLTNPEFRECFAEVHQYLEIVYLKHKIVMCHYPIYDHNGAGRGSIMLHGHRHGAPHNIPGRIMDVGLDATGEVVSSLDSVVERLLKIQPMAH